MASVSIRVDDQELWSNLFGSGFETESRIWLSRIEYLRDTSWDKFGGALLWHVPQDEDVDDDKYFGQDYQKHCDSTIVTIGAIAEALSDAIMRGYAHCGDKIDLDFDNWDACVGDVLLQIVCYGDVIFA